MLGQSYKDDTRFKPNRKFAKANENATLITLSIQRINVIYHCHISPRAKKVCKRESKRICRQLAEKLIWEKTQQVCTGRKCKALQTDQHNLQREWCSNCKTRIIPKWHTREINLFTVGYARDSRAAEIGTSNVLRKPCFIWRVHCSILPFVTTLFISDQIW